MINVFPKVSHVNEEQRDGPNPLFHRILIVSGANKICLKMFISLVFSFSSQEVVS